MGKFTFVRGNHFLHPKDVMDLMREGFVEADDGIDAQVSAEHIQIVLENYLAVNQEADLFFFIEVPVKLDEEKIVKPPMETEPGILASNSRKVYYLDHIDAETCLKLLALFKEILINDGLSAFGFGTKDSEIGKYKYNEILLYNHDETRDWKNIFALAGIPEKEDLTFADDFFTDENPGVAERYDDANGRTVYDVIEVLKENGLYEAEIRSDEDEDE